MRDGDNYAGVIEDYRYYTHIMDMGINANIYCDYFVYRLSFNIVFIYENYIRRNGYA